MPLKQPDPVQGDPVDRLHEARFVALAALAGVGAGLIGSIFHLLIDRLILWPRWLARIAEGWVLVVAAAVIVMVLTCVSLFLVRRFAPEAGGSGVQEIEGAMEGLRVVRWRRVLPVKFFAGIASLGSGLVLGREGPTIHIGASVAAATAEGFKTSDIERRGLLAAGAAAGLACAFNAPIAAVLFIVEETRREFPYTFRTYLGVIVASTTSTIVTQMIGGTAPDLPIPGGQVPLYLLPAFLLLGGVLGLIGVALNTSILRMVAFSAASQIRAPYVYPAAVGLIVGALMILVPDAVTGGERVILKFAAQSPTVAVLLLLALARFATMVGSYSSGVPGGIFAPILSLAVCVGLAFGEGARLLLPDAGFIPLAFAIAAMGGLFTASVRAPIVGVALTLELTGSYVLAVPVMITCFTADLVARWSGGRPIYTQLLERTLALAGVRERGSKGDPIGLA